MHALKIEEYDVPLNVMEQIKDVLENVANDLGLSERIDEIECRRRDGFIPYSSNKGGIRSSGYNTINGVMGSGCFSGSKKFNDLIQKYYDEREGDVEKEFIDEHGEITDDNRDSFYELLNESFDSDYDSICVEYQGRYLGYEKGIHTIELNVFLSLTDAPYFRSSDDDLGITITFKDVTSKSFKNKLKKAVDELTDFIGSLDVY